MTNKRIEFRFAGSTLYFDLSQALFSSFDIDKGTKLLLTVLLKQIDMTELNSVLDLGCGVGVLGITLKKINPRLRLHFTDRDALALDFTRLNCRLNNISADSIEGRLGLSGIEHKSYDLILSNLPAKAGAPVLISIFNQYSGYLKRGGLFAFVIVKPLEEVAHTALVRSGAAIIHRQGTPGHTVFLAAKGKEIPPPQDGFLPYIRGRFNFQPPLKNLSYSLDTVYNLPDFDNLGYQQLSAMVLLADDHLSPKHNILIWNPGQGHLPVYLCRTLAEKQTKFTLAGRDLLALEVTRRNLAAHGVAGPLIESYHTSWLSQIPANYGLIILLPDPESRPATVEMISLELPRLTEPDGEVIIAAKSTLLQRILKQSKGFQLKKRKKDHGYRAVLLVKKEVI